MATATHGLSAAAAGRAYHALETAARGAAVEAGGTVSHHHGVGKLRAPQLQQEDGDVPGALSWRRALRGLKTALDPDNVFGARNGLFWEGDPES